MTEVSNRDTYQSPPCRLCASETFVVKWLENRKLGSPTVTWIAVRACSNTDCEASRSDRMCPVQP